MTDQEPAPGCRPPRHLQPCGEGVHHRLVNGWQRQTGMHIDVLDYSERALTAGTESRRRLCAAAERRGAPGCGVAVGRDGQRLPCRR